MTDAHRGRFLRALAAWAQNFYHVVIGSRVTNGGAFGGDGIAPLDSGVTAAAAAAAAAAPPGGVVVTSGVRKLATRAPPLVVLDSFSKMCTIFAHDEPSDSPLLTELVTLWLALIPRDAGPRGTGALSTALGYLLHQRDAVLHRLARRLVRRLAARDGGMHATALLAFLAARVDAPQPLPLADSGESASRSSTTASPIDVEHESLRRAVKTFRDHVRSLKRAPRRSMNDAGVNGSAATSSSATASTSSKAKMRGGRPMLQHRQSSRNIALGSTRAGDTERRNELGAKRTDDSVQKLALSCILSIDFAPTVRDESVPSLTSTASTTAAVNALLPHLPVLLDTIYFERVYASNGTHFDIDCTHLQQRSVASSQHGVSAKKRYDASVGRFLQTLILHCRLPQRLLAVASIEHVHISTICSIVGTRSPTLRDDWAAVSLRRALASTEPRASAASVLMFGGTIDITLFDYLIKIDFSFQCWYVDVDYGVGIVGIGLVKH